MRLLTSIAFWVSRLLLLLTAVSATHAAWRYRDTHRLNILVVIGWLAVFPYIGPRSWPVTHALAFALLLAQPLFLLRLVRHFTAVPAVVQLTVIGLVALGTLGFVAAPAGARPVFGRVAPIYVAALQLYAAAFTRQAASTAGVTSRRLVYAAAGTWMFAAGFLIAGLAIWLPPAVSAPVNELLEAGVLVCYFLAFNTPRRLRSGWQRAEQARYLSETAELDVEERGRRAAEDLNRAAGRSAGNSLPRGALRPEPGSTDLVVSASSDSALIGARIDATFGLVGRTIQAGTAISGTLTDCQAAIAPRLKAAGTHVLIAPILTTTHTWGVVLVVQRHGSLFPDDDLRLLEQLGRHAGTALDHANLVAESRERERHAAATRLHETESRMELMLDSIKDYAMFVLDEDGLVSTWHIGAEHVFGYRSEEMLHEPAAPLYDMTRAGFLGLLDEARRFGHADSEGPCRRRDGGRFVGATIIRPLKSETEALAGFVAVTRDVTERRELEDRLRQSQKLEAIGQLAGGIAHDFNNMLTAILGYSDLLSRSLADDPHRLQHTDEITKAAERAAALTRQLLAFSRRRMLEPSAVNLSRLTSDLLPMLRSLIGEHVEIVSEPGQETAAVLGDRSQVEQVIVNLVLNARDAMPAGGRLTIRVVNLWLDEATAAGEVLPGAFVMLEVSDTGTGIDLATQRRMFEPFFTTKEFGSGTGLGLATVYGIVKQMGGAIRVESRVGAGTLFRLYFPETRGQESAPVPVPSPARAWQGTETILLVEDDEAVRLFLTKVLERSGYRLIVAERPDLALAMAETDREPIHLVIADVVLPGGTGPQLVKALGRVRPGLPVLYISGHADAVLAHDGPLPKASHYLQKPFSADDLLQRIRQILGSDPFAKAGLTR
jgi:PAS domain S-box-containing protein